MSAATLSADVIESARKLRGFHFDPYMTPLNEVGNILKMLHHGFLYQDDVIAHLHTKVRDLEAELEAIRTA